MTGFDEPAVSSALEAVTSENWVMPETVGDEERKYAQGLLNWVAEVGSDRILEVLEPILSGGWEIIDDIDPEMVWKPHLPSFPQSEDDPAFGYFPPLPDLKDVDKRAMTRLAVLLCSYIFYDEFHYPQPQIGPYDIAENRREKVKWLYRYWFNQLEVAERGSGLEEFFKKQNLDFSQKEYSITNKVTLTCAGDLLAVDVLTPENTPHLFDAITDFYSKADLVCANLESTVYGAKEPGRHQSPGKPAQMNTSETMFKKFRDEAK